MSNPRLARPRLSTKTYENIYTTIHNDTRCTFHNEYDRIRTYGRDGLACSVIGRIFTYKIRTIMNEFITYVEKYIQTPTLVLISSYWLWHLGLACVG